MADNAEQQAAARALELLGGHVEGEEDTTEEELKQTRTEFNEGLATMVAPSSEETVAEETQPEAEPEAVDLPDFDPKLPEDLAEELDMPDWDDEPEATVAEPEDVDDDEEYEDDDRVQALKARLAKAEKRAQWAESKRAESRKEKWQEEAEKYFPLSSYALSDITATSRRGFLREARKAHDAIKPVAMEIAKKYADAHEAAKTTAIEEGRQAATDAWGKPTVAPGGRECTTQEQREEKIQKARNLEERIKTRIWG